MLFCLPSQNWLSAFHRFPYLPCLEVQFLDLEAWVELSLEAQVRLMRLSLSIPKSPSLGLGVELRDLLLKARPLYTPADISLSTSWSHLQIPPVRTRLTSCAAGVLDFWTTVHAFSASAILLQNLPIWFFPSSLQTRHFLRLRSSRYSGFLGVLVLQL